MYWSKKNDLEDKQEQVAIWECQAEDCLGWMRKNFSFEDHPNCPLCGNTMKSGERLLYNLKK
jgi:hypothetical protein